MISALSIGDALMAHAHHFMCYELRYDLMTYDKSHKRFGRNGHGSDEIIFAIY